MPRNILTQHLNTFFCHLDSDTQHTFIEVDNVRFVYQRMGLLYLVILTTINSNIFEDLETMRTFIRIVNQYCVPLNDDTVKKNSFTLIYAFDELISLGYRENVTIEDIKKAIEMSSENEVLAEIIKKVFNFNY